MRHSRMHLRKVPLCLGLDEMPLGRKRFDELQEGVETALILLAEVLCVHVYRYDCE